MDTNMVDTHHDDDYAWLCDVEQHDGPQGWGKWQHNSLTQRGPTYGNYSGVGSSGEESSIITLLENMHVEKWERHEEESYRRHAFEAAQEERFRLVYEHMTAQVNNFNNFAMYGTEQFNQVHRDMGFNHGST